MVYARKLGRSTFTFQVSGRLWRNSLIMQDRESGTWWSQVTGRAIHGGNKGSQLAKLESVETTWARWIGTHPETTVLAKDEAVKSSRYQKYFEDPERMGLFRAQYLADRMPGKTLVYGAAVGPHAVAVTDAALDRGPVSVSLGDVQVVIKRGPDGGVRGAAAATSAVVAVTPVYWFAWSSFYPNTQVVD